MLTQEQIDAYRTIDGQLYIPGHDPDEASADDYYRPEADVWTAHATISNMVHNYDMHGFNQNLFAALNHGSGFPLRLSQDDGQT